MDLVLSASSDKCEKKLQDYINECEPLVRAGRKKIGKKTGPIKKSYKGFKKSLKKSKKSKNLNCKERLIFCFLTSLSPKSKF